MLDTGNGLLKIFANKESDAELGIIRYLALATDDIDGCVKAVKSAGYEVLSSQRIL